MKKGSALILVILILSLFLGLAALFAKIVYNNHAQLQAAITREQAFFLAEAGVEKGKVQLAHHPGWYTDLPYYLEDNPAWLTDYAVGETAPLGEGSYKIVRERNQDHFYAVGRQGKGIVILKLTFTNPPFRPVNWTEL